MGMGEVRNKTARRVHPESISHDLDPILSFSSFHHDNRTYCILQTIIDSQPTMSKP
jgi:hypothetical protein